MKVFTFSITYVTVLFAALTVDVLVRALMAPDARSRRSRGVRLP